ncbi:unnamed protein product [Pleuronectes platessa]|uniref:Uncharacterized protein n=1 Tax=Pleuronectes platessa TaxID=8262 RepID=A0A9N7YSW1_PLEPL|nr:unnamed protein product [Pleuronectes platessa]
MAMQLLRHTKPTGPLKRELFFRPQGDSLKNLPPSLYLNLARGNCKEELGTGPTEFQAEQFSEVAPESLIFNPPPLHCSPIPKTESTRTTGMRMGEGDRKRDKMEQVDNNEEILGILLLPKPRTLLPASPSRPAPSEECPAGLVFKMMEYTTTASREQPCYEGNCTSDEAKSQQCRAAPLPPALNLASTEPRRTTRACNWTESHSGAPLYKQEAEMDRGSSRILHLHDNDGANVMLVKGIALTLSPLRAPSIHTNLLTDRRGSQTAPSSPQLGPTRFPGHVSVAPQAAAGSPEQQLIIQDPRRTRIGHTEQIQQEHSFR